MLDMADTKTLENYLLGRGVIDAATGYSITYCKGGVSCIVAFVRAGEKELIIKQALAQLQVKETWLCDPNRMHIEYECNALYHRLAPDMAPAVCFYDDEHYIMGREAVPERCPMWKAQLLSGLLDFSVAEKVIRALAAVHAACAHDPEVARLFGNKDIFYGLRVSPYIEFTLGKYGQLKDFASPLVEELMGPGITLVHGDFSPKNIMIDDRNVRILDFEVAHYGHPAFDLAFFSVLFLCKSVKHKAWAAAYRNLLAFMLDTYFDNVAYMNNVALEASFVRLLALMLLARVDGKSPAEYITEEVDRERLRAMAFAIIDSRITTRAELFAMLETLAGPKRHGAF